MEVAPPHELLDTASAGYTGRVTGWMGWIPLFKSSKSSNTTMTTRASVVQKALGFCESTGSTSLCCCFSKLQGCVKGAQDHAVLQK